VLLFPVGGRFISSSKRPDPLSSSLSLVFSGYWEFLLWSVKQPGREVDHSPHSIAEVKNKQVYTIAPPYVFVAWRRINP